MKFSARSSYAAICIVLTFTAASGRAQTVAASNTPLPPGYTLAGKGDVHDFDYLIGAWTTQQKVLKKRGIGSTEWTDAPSNQHCAVSYLGGLDIVEDSWSPAQKPMGLFVYFYSPSKQQWAIRWVNPKTGEPDPPSVGGFDGKRGEFYGEDTDQGKPIKFRITWTKTDSNHARWEQAYSYDNRTWETNWVTDYTRANTAICHK